MSGRDKSDGAGKATSREPVIYVNEKSDTRQRAQWSLSSQTCPAGVYPKADGSERPLGVTALEDKNVQGAVVQVLNAIYEQNFLGLSYGFRPLQTPARRVYGRSESETEKSRYCQRCQ